MKAKSSNFIEDNLNLLIQGIISDGELSKTSRETLMKSFTFLSDSLKRVFLGIQNQQYILSGIRLDIVISNETCVPLKCMI